MHDKHFANVNVRDGEIFSYRSGMTVFEEGYKDGCFSSLGWNGAGFTLNVLESYPSYFNRNDFINCESFSLDVNGYTLSRGWKYDGYTKSENENGVTVIIKLVNSLFDIVAYLKTVVDGTAILTRSLEFENVGKEKLALGNITVLNVGLDRMDGLSGYLTNIPEGKLYSIGYFENAHHMHEGLFRWHDISNARLCVQGAYQRDRYRHPAIIIKNNAQGSIWFAQLAYSGGWAFDFDYNSDNNRNFSTASLRVRIEGENPTIVLNPGEKTETPAVHIGMTCGGLDDIVNEMHSHARKSVFTIPPARGINGGLVEGGMGAERIMDINAVKHFADTMAMIGAETLIIDAGWYCPPGFEGKEWSKRVGDWEYNKELYPLGIDEVREYIHSKGLLFGMWAEVERGGVMSKLYAEKPEWFITNKDGKRTDVLDVCKQEVIEYIENSICRLVCDYKIDLFRLDYNICFKDLHYTNENGEDGAYRGYQNVCAMFDRLRAKYPNVIFENCASGGGRTDLAFVSRFTHSWVSDEQKQPIACSITNGMTMVLPPEYVDRLASGMDSHRCGALDIIVRNTLFGRPTFNSFNCIGSEFNPCQIEFVRHSIDIYKNIVRPFAPTGKIFHHTPESYGDKPHGTVVLERSAEDKRAGIIGIFRLTGNNADETIVYPKGVDLGGIYEVIFDNSGESVRLSGYEMVNCGIHVRIASNLSSELIIYKKV